MGPSVKQELFSMIEKIVQKIESSPSDCDVMFYRGEIDRAGYEQVSDLCEMDTGRKNVLLVLETPGGL